MSLLIPAIDQLKFIDRQNNIIHNFRPAQIINEFEFLESDPFSISSDGVTYVSYLPTNPLELE